MIDGRNLYEIYCLVRVITRSIGNASEFAFSWGQLIYRWQTALAIPHGVVSHMHAKPSAEMPEASGSHSLEFGMTD
jgi:hypothetical protein